MAGEGMVSVMQGLRECGLSVALLDEDGKAYTLVPRAVERKTTSTAAMTSRCDAGSQATDGRYATVYKVHHCKVTPTSPPDNLPEFPPQRAEICPGHDNFEVGGTGSGETYVPTKSSSVRAGMYRTDRGSVCSRSSRDPDAFASSLRKYPVSPDRSAELVERLITYSQHNNYSRSNHRAYSPPCRAHDLTPPHCSPRLRQGAFEPGASAKRQRSPEEYPTRERCYGAELCRKSTFCKSSDIRFVRDVSRRLKDSIKCMSSYTVVPHTPTNVRDMYEIPTLETYNSNVVDTEIQAAASMVSRKVCTVPLPVPITRTVAIPLTPTSSNSRPDQTLLQPIDPCITKSVQTIEKLLIIKSVQTTTSFTDIPRKVKVATRRSKSFSDVAIDKELKDEILEWLDDTADPKVKELRDAVLRKLSNRLKRIPGANRERQVKNDREKYYDKLYMDHIDNELHGRVNYLYVCKSADTLKNEADQSFDDALDNQPNNIFGNARKEWVYDASKERCDWLRPVITEKVCNKLLKRLKHSTVKKSAHLREESLRAEIVKLFDEVPINFHGFSKRVYLNTLVDALITKLENIKNDQKDPEHLYKDGFDQSIPQTSKKYSQSTAKDRISLPQTTKTKVIEKIQANNNDAEHFDCDISEAEGIAGLFDHITELPENYTAEFAMQYSENVNDIPNEKRFIIDTQPKTILLVQNTSKTNSVNAYKTEANISGTENRYQDIESNKYINQLTKQIEEWLSSFKVGQAHDEELRKAVVNDLANDIIDRHKYLELNNNRGSDIDEIEHLKYQIFKWINKLVGEDNTETIEHAADLMLRIKNISVPITSTPQDQYDHDTSRSCSQREAMCSKCTNVTVPTSSGKCYSKDVQNKESTERHAQTDFPAANSSQNKTNNTSQGVNTSQKQCSRNSNGSMELINDGSSGTRKPMSSLRPPCCSGPPPGTPSLKQLNDDFDAYITNWVKEIPIPANSPEEEAIAEKTRLGIHNGIWKVITKMKFDPSMFHNKFLYEDVLEEELDGLLNLLPQSQELQEKRHFLKAKLIEKTTETNELIWSAASPASYRQQLAQQVTNNLPRTVVNTDEEDPNKLYEEMLILCIADDFLMSARYKDEDKVKANAYRNKLIRKIEAIIDEVKRTHGKELQDLNDELCVNDVVSALHKVPLPTEETIRQEADEILLGFEIDQWFNDLPIAQNDDITEQLHRRRLKDALAKKLHELEKEVNIADCSGEPQFKHEISMFLEKVPLEKDESLNINVMVDKLTNRIKNREKSPNKRKSVVFEDAPLEYKEQQGRPDETSSRLHSQAERQDASSQDGFGYRYNMSRSDSINPGYQYDAFSKDVPACSSMINPPPEPQEFRNELPDYRQRGSDSKPPENWYSFDTKGNLKESSTPNNSPNLADEPGPIREENFRGSCGYTLHGQIPMTNRRNDNLADSRNAMERCPMIGTFLDSQGNLNPSAPVCQQQMTPAPVYHDQVGGMGNHYERAPQNSATGPPSYNSQGAKPQIYPGTPQNMDATSAYDGSVTTPSFKQFHSERPPSSSWKESSSEFVSLLHDSKGPPQSYIQQSWSAPPNHHQELEPYMQPSDRTLGGRFGDTNSQAPQPCQNCSQRADSPRRRDRPPEPKQPANMDLRSMDQSQQGQPSMHTSQVRQNVKNASQAADRSVCGPALGTDFNRTASAADEPVIDRTRTVNTPFRWTGPDRSASQHPSMPNQNGSTLRMCPHVTMNDVSNRDASPTLYEQDHRHLGPKQPLSGMSMSNEPVGFSTPNRQTSNADSSNIKARRQFERESANSATDDEGEEIRVRCQCFERFNKKRCRKKHGGFFGCNECMGGFPYYFPMGCPYPYFFNDR